MYGNLPKIPPFKRLQKQRKRRSVPRPRTTAGLSRGLHQGLKQGLYQGLHQGSKSRSDATPGAHKMAPAAQKIEPGFLPSDPSGPSGAVASVPGTKIRKVGLLSGETVTHTFCPGKGLVPDILEDGRMLVLTNQRVIAFGHGDGMRETILMPVEEVKAVAVNAGRRSRGTLFQGGLMLMAGVFFYVLLAYWLTGRIDGPTIPIIRMDLVAFLVFLAILSGIGVMAQFYFSKPDGEVAFQGDGVKLVFPFNGETAGDQIYQVVDATFAARQLIRANSGQGLASFSRN